eukprot:jgi/Botrbrau1/16509/Bobra.0142s0103.1
MPLAVGNSMPQKFQRSLTRCLLLGRKVRQESLASVTKTLASLTKILASLTKTPEPLPLGRVCERCVATEGPKPPRTSPPPKRSFPKGTMRPAKIRPGKATIGPHNDLHCLGCLAPSRPAQMPCAHTRMNPKQRQGGLWEPHYWPSGLWAATLLADWPIGGPAGNPCARNQMNPEHCQGCVRANGRHRPNALRSNSNEPQVPVRDRPPVAPPPPKKKGYIMAHPYAGSWLCRWTARPAVAHNSTQNESQRPSWGGAGGGVGTHTARSLGALAQYPTREPLASWQPCPPYPFS